MYIIVQDLNHLINDSIESNVLFESYNVSINNSNELSSRIFRCT